MNIKKKIFHKKMKCEKEMNIKNGNPKWHLSFNTENHENRKIEGSAWEIDPSLLCERCVILE